MFATNPLRFCKIPKSRFQRLGIKRFIWYKCMLSVPAALDISTHFGSETWMVLCISTGWGERTYSRPSAHVLLHRLQRFLQRRHKLLRQAGKKTKTNFLHFLFIFSKMLCINDLKDIKVFSCRQIRPIFPPGHSVLHSDQDCDVSVEGRGRHGNEPGCHHADHGTLS